MNYIRRLCAIMDTSDNLIYLRIMLSRMCDGFSSDNSSKLTTLSIRTKILFLLKDKDLSPSELISMLCIAKSNLVNTVKPMITDGVIITYKNSENSKNIFYRITDKGINELRDYKHKLFAQFSYVCKGSEEQMKSEIEKINEIIKGIEIC